MRIELGATVRTADGEDVGTIDQLVMDSNKQAVTYFILRTGRFFNHDYVVPFDSIASEDDDNTLNVVFTAAQLRQLPEYEEANFAIAEHPADTELRYLIPATDMGAMLPAGPSGRGTPAGTIFEAGGENFISVQDSTDEMVIRRSNLPEWDYRIGRGTKVVTRDDHTVGAFHETDVDADGRPQVIVIATGHLHRGHSRIPISLVRSADAEQILLDLTKGEYDKRADEFAKAAEA